MKFPGWSEDMMENWQSMLNSQQPSQANDFMKRALDMGKAYTAMAEDALAAKDANANPLDSWVDMMEKGFTAWSKPPEKEQTVADLVEKYRQAMTTYMGAFSEQGLDSVKVLRERLEAIAKDGGNIKSLRELYDLWVDVSEEAYSKFAMSKQYQEIYGDLVNSGVALKASLDSMIAEQLKSSNMPSQKDLDEAVKALHEAKRENELLKDQIAELNDKLKMAQSNKPAATKAASTPKAATKTKAAPVSKPKAKAAPKTTAKSAPKTKAIPKTASKAKAIPKAEPKGKTAPSQKQPNAAVKPKAKPAKVTPDDLTKIKGIGPKMSEQLIDAGIQTFDQLAALSTSELEALDKKVLPQGRASRDGWVAQAAALAGTRLA